ncbi:hypothetical protein VPH35_111788 [Triticum aestivum]
MPDALCLVPPSCTSHITKSYPSTVSPPLLEKQKKNKTLAKGRRRRGAPPPTTQQPAAAVLGAPGGWRRRPRACCSCCSGGTLTWSRNSTFASASSAPGNPLPTGAPSSFAPTPPPSVPSLATPMPHRCAAVLLCGDRPR